MIIYWIGVGRGPRLWPLAFVLFVAAPRGARRALEHYARSISLSEGERHRLPGIMAARAVEPGPVVGRPLADVGDVVDAKAVLDGNPDEVEFAVHAVAANSGGPANTIQRPGLPTMASPPRT